MTHYSMQLSQRLGAAAAAEELVKRVELDLAGRAVAGALMLATAAAGRQALEVGQQLARCWPEASLLGSSFEGVLGGGRVLRDVPALAVLAWSGGGEEPLPLAWPAGGLDGDAIAHEVLAATGGREPGPDALLLLFPDAHEAPGPSAWLDGLVVLLGGTPVAGSAATGLGGSPALAWVDGEPWDGGTVGLLLPAVGGGDPSGRAPSSRSAGASRAASPWLEVSRASGHWVEGLEGEPPLDWVRRQLGLEPLEPVEPHLRTLLVRIRRAREGGRDASGRPIYDERYVVGLDPQRGAFSVPVEVARGDEIAFALPDAGVARQGLRDCIDRIAATPWLMQLACRARDEALHGDADLEAAIVAAHAPDRATLGTIAPFQLGPDASGRCRQQIHSTVLVSLGGA